MSNKYPVSREMCEGCSSCHMVTHGLFGDPISEPYYQCISDMDDECAGAYDTPMSNPYAEPEYLLDEDMEDMHPEDREIYGRK